jgi:hypothetical protein
LIECIAVFNGFAQKWFCLTRKIKKISQSRKDRKTAKPQKKLFDATICQKDSSRMIRLNGAISPNATELE